MGDVATVTHRERDSLDFEGEAMTKTLSYKDATVTVHAGFLGEVMIDVECRNLNLEGVTSSELAALVYPAIDAKAVAVAQDEGAGDGRESKCFAKTYDFA